MHKLSKAEIKQIQRCITHCNKVIWGRPFHMFPIIRGVQVLHANGYNIALADKFYIEHCKCKDDEYSMSVASTGYTAGYIKDACKQALMRNATRMVFPTTTYNTRKQYIAHKIDGHTCH